MTDEPVTPEDEPDDDELGDPGQFRLPLAPETHAALRRISRDFAQQIRPIENRLERVSKALVGPALKAVAEAAASISAATAGWRSGLDEFYKSVLPQLPDFSEWARHAVRAFKENLPPNWDVDNWHAVIDLMEMTGWSLIWVPGPTVLSELVEARTREEADEKLVRCSEAALVDMDACLDDVADDALHEHVEGLRAAIGAARLGLHPPAQALAATLLSGLVHEHEETLSRARKKWGNADWLETPMSELRRTGVWVAVAAALDTFSPGNGPVPSRFNRHAVAHGYSSVQFTPANALSGLLLAVSLVRELQELQESRGEDESGT